MVPHKLRGTAMQICVSEQSDPQAIRDYIGMESSTPHVMLVMGEPGNGTVRHCTSMAVARQIPIEYIRQQPRAETPSASAAA